MGIAMEAGFREHQVAFVTAYADPDDGAFKGSVSELAWQSSHGLCRNRITS